MKVYLGVKSGVKYEDGTSLNDVMKFNTYGTETIPPRPVLQMAAENTIPKNGKRIGAFLKNLAVYGMLGRKKDIEEIEKKLFTSLGQQVVAEAKRIIESGDQLQENAPSTIAKKKSDKPLYETGLMKKNIGYSVEK
jgi:hypothetical protein